ncbi:RING-type E3 ubiquitin-protein ligase PPIL2 isoform X2 [Heterodontus francisci]|uniref:RING-type E3 ubiquitin-protein ligase PPIL2 isoform X2 n=1 Tax=Heterodontus francisci TaxID=7792 RepID=UPI00355BBC23
MGKRQHQKDKMYITCTEYTNFYGGKKTVVPQANFRRLPFDHCSLSLQPFEYPVCTPDGMVFDLLNIIPWIKKFGTHPTTGEKLDVKSLIKLTYHKNSEGKYHCPVMYSVFTNNSHIMTVKPTGNVYSYEAVEQLNVKTKSYKDLLNDEPFNRQDIITLQDPSNVDKFNVSNFFHVKNDLKVPDPDEEKAKSDPSYHLKTTSLELRETLSELYRDYKGNEILASTMKEPEKKKVDKINAAHYSTGKVSASFTSTAMMPETTHEAAAVEDDQVRYRYVKKKGYVRLHTNKGDLNLELHCEMTPKACENFIKLCKKGYYDGTIFHRSIRNFMIQGGDPTGTGTGGESYWGKPFKDEFKHNLSHAGRGILSMANSGPNTNKSQFFITFRSCIYLDKKHTIFGRLQQKGRKFGTWKKRKRPKQRQLCLKAVQMQPQKPTDKVLENTLTWELQNEWQRIRTVDPPPAAAKKSKGSPALATSVHGRAGTKQQMSKRRDQQQAVMLAHHAKNLFHIQKIQKISPGCQISD